MPKITILIAVYNAEKFLAECLDSLLAQTMTDFQAVCVDDGSTDGSWRILEDYAARDRRIEIVSLGENRGQAYARNVALRQARGAVTCFLDSDDFLSPDALQQAVSVFGNYPETGAVLYRVVYCDEAGNAVSDYQMDDFSVMSGEEAFRASLTWQIHGVYAVRTDLHRQYPYDDSSLNYSDDNTTRLHFLNSREVRTCSGTYFYRQHPESVTHRVNVRRYDYLNANTSMKRQLLDLQVGDEILSLYENLRWVNCVGLYMFYFNHRSAMSREDNRHGLAEIKKVWEGIETKRLYPRNRRKFGYFPFRKCWILFRLQEEIYFLLRRIKYGRTAAPA